MNNQSKRDGKQIALKSAIALSLLTTLAGQSLIYIPAAQAQSASPSQDSLLPPEVVPLDANAGAAMQAAQTNSFNAPAVSAQPAQQPAQLPPQEMQTSQEWRKAAYASLMNNPNAQPIANQQAQMAPPQMANQAPGMQAPGMNPNMNNAPQQAGQLGQSGWMGGNGQPTPAANQSQTLTGQVQQQPTNKKNSTSKLTGLAHAASMAAMFGSGAMVGALMMSRSPAYGAYSTGMFGGSLINYGARVPYSMW